MRLDGGLWVGRRGGFEFLQKAVEPIEGGLPEFAVLFEPLTGFGEWGGGEAAGAALGVAVAGDEAGALEDFEVLGDGGLGHGEWLGQLVHRGFSQGEAGEDGAASGVGEGGERGVEALVSADFITD